MDDFWDFLFNSWWPFIIGGVCCFGVVLAVAVVLVIVLVVSLGRKKRDDE